MVATRDVTLAAHVSTSDGKLLGTVKELAADRFKVDAPRRRDYWLPMWSVRTSYAGAVELAYRAEAISDLKTREPSRDAIDEMQAPERLV